MPNQQLLDYVKRQLAEGLPEGDIKKALLQNDWSDKDIEEVFSLTVTPVSPASQSSMSEPEVLPPKTFSPAEPAQSRETMSSAMSSPIAFAGVGVLIGRAWNVYRKRFWTLIAINIVPFALTFLYGIFLDTSALLDMSGIVVMVATVLFTLLLIVVSLWSQVSILHTIKDSTERIGIIESYRRGWKKLLSYWWVMILVTVVIIGGSIPLLIPGILFAVWFFLAPYVLVSENIKGMDALMKSKGYVQGKWWGVFGRVLAVFIPVVAIIVAVVVALTAIGIPEDSVVIDFVVQIINLFVLPFIFAYSFSIYQSLKEARGEFVFNPNKGKGKFIVVGIFGVLIILLGLLSPIILANLKVAREKAQDTFRKFEVDALNIKIVDYYNEKGALPQLLNDLVVLGQDDGKIRDNVTNELYEYRVEQGGTYSLCASQHGGEKYCVGDLEVATRSVFEDISLLPKYGGVEKTEDQVKADQDFVNGIIEEMGSRANAVLLILAKGFLALDDGDVNIAMQRFNQAWLIDPQNPDIYMGMSIIEVIRGNLDFVENLLLEGLRYDGTHTLLRCNLGGLYLYKSEQSQGEIAKNDYLRRSKEELEKALVYEPDIVECKNLQTLLDDIN